MQRILAKLTLRKEPPLPNAPTTPSPSVNHVDYLIWESEPPPLPSAAYTRQCSAMYTTWRRGCWIDLAAYTKKSEVDQVPVTSVGSEAIWPKSPLGSMPECWARFFANKTTTAYVFGGDWLDTTMELSIVAFVQWAEKHAATGKALPKHNLEYAACAAPWVHGLMGVPELSEVARLHTGLAHRVKSLEGQMETRGWVGLPDSNEFYARQTFQESFLVVDGRKWREWKEVHREIEGSNTFTVDIVMKSCMAANTQLDGWDAVVEQLTEVDSTSGWVQRSMDFKSAIALIVSLDEM